jgi:PAS domain S-box-containing protein
MHAKIGGAPTLEQQLASLRRLALAVAHPGGPALHADLVSELAAALDVAVVFVAVYADDERTTLRTLAAQLDGRMLKTFSYLLRDSPCIRAVTPGFHYVPAGVAAEFRSDTIFAAKGMDAYAAYPLASSTGEPLGLLVAMDRQPIVGGDAEYAEAMLKIVAGRLAAEIERSRTDEVLRTTALAVSGARSGTVFDELVRLLAATLHVEQAFIARQDPADPAHLSMLARYQDGQVMHDFRYPVAGTPCETVLGQRFRAFPEHLQQHFPDDADVRAQGVESYAGFPLMASDGQPLGILAVTSRRPLAQLERVEAMLKIVAVRAAAEIERLAASEALARSEASYRTIFDNAEDAIFIHDWETGRILDANRRACESFGWTREEFASLSVAEICAGMPPYTVDDALRWIRLAKIDRCPPFEWRRRNKDGSLRWDEVRLKPTTIDGRPHVLAFARDITERKTALATLQAQEQKYRSIFDSTADSMVLWNDELRVVDVNAAFVDMTGLTREEIVGRHWTERPDRDDIERLLPRIEGALAGREESAIERVSRADGTAFDIELRYLPVHFGDARFALGVGRDVTARIEHERELARSTARLRATVEAAFDGVIGMDGQGRIVEFNAAAERIFGHRRKDVLGRLLADVLLPQRHREAHTRGLARFHGAGQSSMIGRLVETTALHAAGHEIPVELAISVAAVPEGSIFVGHVRDITERRRADQALRDSEAQYRAIFNASADPLVLRDADFRIVDVNLAYEGMSGYTRDEVIGADHLTANPPDMTDVIRTLHARALAGEAIALDTQFVRRDGKHYDLELRGVPIHHRGQPHVLYVGRDITERKRAEEALRDSEAQYRAIFNASVDALVLWDSQYRRVDVNQAYERIYGWKRNEVVGRGYEHPIFSAEYVRQRRELIRRALAGEACNAELEGVHKNGQRIQIEVHVIPFLQRGERHVLAISRDITERKRADDALRNSEEQHRTIFNASVDGMLVKDADDLVVDVNEAYLRMHGFAREELIGRCLLDYLPGDLRARCTELLPQVMVGTPCHFEAQTRRRDGSLLDVEIHGVPVVYGGQTRALVVMRDITERKRAEAALRDSEAQYRAIFNASADALTLWDSQYRRVDVNQAYERIYGWTRDEVVGCGYEHPVFSAEYVRQRRELIRRALAGEACSAELEAVHRNGQRIQTEVHVIPFLQRGERHVLAISRDITERKRAEDALRDSEAQYRAIFNASADALVLRDADFRIVEVNPAYTTLSGYSRDELLALPRVVWQEDERMQQLHRADHERVLAGDVMRLEHTARRKDGRRLQIEVRGTPVSYRGRPHVLYAVRDMTERHAAEQRRVELERQLRQAQKMEAIGQLTGGIAHDFNNILASVIGYLVLAQERAEAIADSTLVRQLGQAHLAADRARELIAQMLTFARRQRGERRVLEIAPLLQQTLSLLRATLPSTVALEVELPAADAELPFVQADPVQLEQVLLNLCINARDATGGQGRIGVRLQCVDTAPAWHCASCRAAVAGGPWVVLSVQDDGPGIDPDHVERIFDPFFSTKAPGKGSGMGLAMVHGIVHDHGGHLELDSGPGRGARFAIWLPRATSLEAESVGAPAVPPVPAPLRGRVLLVEDDTMLGDFLCERLSGWGLDVELKRESPAADVWLSDPAHAVDLLITDQTMPSLTGLQLAARTHERRPTLPIVLISGNAEGFEADELARCGVAAALPKPLDGEQLRAVLRRLLADTAPIQVGR